MIALIVAVLIVLILVLNLFLPYHYEWLFKWKACQQLSSIPGPPTVPYFGNILTFNVPHDQILQKLADLHESYGAVFRIWIMGMPRVFLVDPEDVEVIMNSRVHISKSREYVLLTPWLGQGLLTSGGQRWHSHRKMLTPAFHFKILEEYIDVFNSNANIMIERLVEKCNNIYVDICPYVADCTLDIICDVDVRSYRMTELVVHRQMRPWLYRPSIFNLSPTGREQHKVLQTLHNFTNQVIEERRAEYRANISSYPSNEYCKRKRLAFLDLLIEMSETENKLTNTDIREEVDTFMFEGHDTTTAGISWALFSIASNPTLQEKVVDELEQIFGDSSRAATYEDLQNMRYLEKVIKETLRLYPSVPGVCRKLDVDVQVQTVRLSRIATRDINNPVILERVRSSQWQRRPGKTGNFTIPAGTEITIMPYFVHRNATVFQNPHDFNPENFKPEESLKRHPFSYIPFSAGPRNCIGQRYAMLEEKVVISTVIRKFKLEALERKEDIPHMFELILRPKNGLKIKLTPRDSVSS